MLPSVYPDSNADASGSSRAIGTLAGVRFVGAQKPFVHALGLNAAVYLNECLYWQAQVGLDNWFGRTIPQMQEETGLSKAEQAKARDILRERGLIEEQKAAGFRTKTRIKQDGFARLLDILAEKRDEQARSAVQKSAAQNETAGDSADQKSAASRPEIVGSSNKLEHTKTLKSLSNEENAIDYVQLEEEEGIVFRTSPWDVWVRFCDARRLSIDHLTGSQRQLQLNTAKLILKDGMALDDVTGVTLWLMSDPWWADKGFDLNSVRKQYARWVSSGRPVRQKAPGSKAIRGTTPSI